MNRSAAIYALLSAALFGASTPAAKALLGSVDPAILAGLLYCGAGIGAGSLRRLLVAAEPARVSQAPLGVQDMPWLAAAILAGGVIGPLLLMFGLTRTDAATASLLLTFEAAATAAIAWLIFHEPLGRRVAAGMTSLTAGAVALSWTGSPSLSSILGPLVIVGACMAWGLDNNLTRKVSLADPLQIVTWKGLIAGPINLALAFLTGAAVPPLGSVALAAVVGFFGYGVSIALFIMALRDLGTARTGAYFSTAPFIGGVVAVALLGDALTPQLLFAGVLMAFGVWLHLTEHHEHTHTHEQLAHTHAHVHDAHHQHQHDADAPPGQPHTHFHVHPTLRHSHPHMPDVHHRHRHGRWRLLSLLNWRGSQRPN